MYASQQAVQSVGHEQSTMVTTTTFVQIEQNEFGGVGPSHTFVGSTEKHLSKHR
jgi:hypothetical protein